ncbi:hydrolase [Pseudoalteromonas luteoviolacea]|uniref:Alpha/beta hydrolase n=1 Tax=Pseudoalteromonas luteoviolacea S4054 TaxID=1129367 RepID=A0A0F6A6C7_9GAMM|nr:hydrolase [Pseudoalteromonas luteoviolacea]AOT06503.1 alpha/beta hydrolase [Pseudoalteromonas luteoviolacea]AOT11420.1 alpha/beta hydrolase [Pseudoalteromonas luteoviolacea]AOT16333.1 alpha/beta hydrolase [Pseudoalteromonas luteoviolacea]KKE81673.1 alpha/beta hydrolase [Pseudoalteromonas luteoviolacea S4054]KZN71172.1 alpha/beta hydrolase [Pseudoalteromonas luteoviolacea S4047-1]
MSKQLDLNFKPAWWMRNRHVQTILPRAFRPRLKADVNFEHLTTPDDDFLELAWANNGNAHAPLVVVLHGLEGNINSFYAKGMLRALTRSGLDAVLMHFRNCSKDVNKQPRAYHSGETQDLSFLIKTLSERFPGRALFAVGFSLGGNVLAKYLGEKGQASRLAGAAVISAPYHLSSSCQVIRKSCFKLYQKYLLDRMKHSFTRKLDQIKNTIDISASELSQINDLWQFDDRVTAPLHGFKGAEDYYAQASSQPYLSLIETPTLLIHAEDDPMLSTQAIPLAKQTSPKVKLAVSSKGGHVGFIAGNNPLKPIYWLEKVVPEYIHSLIK